MTEISNEELRGTALEVILRKYFVDHSARKLNYLYWNVTDAKDMTLNFVNLIGKTPIVVKDTPGFIANRVSQPLYSESLRLLGENVANAEQIDRIVKIIGGFPAGPFESMDQMGIDATLAEMQSLFEQSYGEPRLRPHPILKQMVESGLLGKKTGKGFFSYEESK